MSDILEAATKTKLALDDLIRTGLGVKCVHCTNPATQDGLCYPHHLATHHKGITMYELRKKS